MVSWLRIKAPPDLANLSRHPILKLELRISPFCPFHRFQVGQALQGRPTPVGSPVSRHRLARVVHDLFPPTRNHCGPELEHRFRILFSPVNTRALETKVDDSSDRALDRAASQRYATAPETLVAQSSRLGVPGQIAELAPHGRIFRLARRQHLQFGDDVATLARLEKSPKSAVKLPRRSAPRSNAANARLR